MIDILKLSIVFSILIFLCVYGWVTYFSLRKRRKSRTITTTPFFYKKKCTPIINKPQKIKDEDNGVGIP